MAPDESLVPDAEALGDPAVLFESLTAHATALLFAEDFERCRAAAERALDLYHADPSVAIPGAVPGLAHLYNRLHVAADWSGQFRDAYRYGAEALIAAGVELGQGVLLADVFGCEVNLGIVGRATELYAATGWRPASQAPGGRWAEISIARLVAVEGNAREPIARMVAIAEQTDPAELPDMLRWQFASWGAAYAIEQGHLDIAERALDRLDEMRAAADVYTGRRQHVEYAVLQAEVAYARGEVATARRRLAELDDDDPFNALVLARADLLRATDAMAAGEPRRALAALDAAAGRFDMLPAQLRPRFNRLRRSALADLGELEVLVADLSDELGEIDHPRRRQTVVAVLGEDLAARLDAVFDELQESLVGHLRWEQSEVVEAISHDLAGAAALVRLSLGLLDTDRERVAGALVAATQRMRAIVDSFALLVSIERSRLRPALTAHSLVALVDRVIANVRPLAESKQMRIQVDHGVVGAASVLADVGFFEMSLSNVVANAVKYSPPGTSIEVRLLRLGGLVAVSVSDEGPGLAGDELESVFQRHVRGRARPTGTESSLGLGLYISRAICELMGGRVWAESRGPGQGATFTLALPEQVGREGAA